MAHNNIISTIACIGSFRIHGNINGVAVSLLIDTGSPVTLLNREIRDKISNNGNPEMKPWQGQRFVGVNGATLDIWGCSSDKIEAIPRNILTSGIDCRFPHAERNPWIRLPAGV